LFSKETALKYDTQKHEQNEHLNKLHKHHSQFPVILANYAEV